MKDRKGDRGKLWGAPVNTIGTNESTKTVLYLHLSKNPVMHRRVLDGMRRFVQTVGWRVEPVRIDGLSSAALRELVRSSGAIGCVRACGRSRPNGGGRPFGVPYVPVVLVDPPETDRSRRAGAVFCDNAAIAKAAFRELSSGHPPSYAAVAYWDPAQGWAKERITAFCALCAEAGRPCSVFPQSRLESPEVRMARLADWVAALPNHVAIFAANDFTAVEMAIALHSRHRPVPKTATLVGVDGSPERHDIAPSPVPLSSVNVNFESAGFLAARTLAVIVAARNATKHKANPANSANPANGVNDVNGANTPPPLYGPMMVVRRESTRGRGRREPFVLEAAETIRREACDGLTAVALAARFPVSRKHFERRFREATGHSVLDEILHVRLEQVQAYLLRRDVAIDAIAGFCGFGSGIELRRLFRRRFGVSMSEWRARNSMWFGGAPTAADVSRKRPYR